jgi:hypothetical protein
MYHSWRWCRPSWKRMSSPCALLLSFFLSFLLVVLLRSRAGRLDGSYASPSSSKEQEHLPLPNRARTVKSNARLKRGSSPSKSSTKSWETSSSKFLPPFSSLSDSQAGESAPNQSIRRYCIFSFVGNRFDLISADSRLAIQQAFLDYVQKEFVNGQAEAGQCKHTSST